MSHKKNKKPRLLWAEQAHLDQAENSWQHFEDSGWIAPFKHEASNGVAIFIKAGSKDYALSSSTEEKLKLSPLQLKKKYRCKLGFF
jgi:hypothetical protein